MLLYRELRRQRSVAHRGFEAAAGRHEHSWKIAPVKIWMAGDSRETRVRIAEREAILPIVWVLMLFLTSFAIVPIASAQVGWAEGEQSKYASFLGGMIAADETCDLRYNQAAISRLIEETVPDHDLAFPSLLEAQIQLHTFSQKKLQNSGKTAFCAQMQRAAKSHGLIE